MASTSTATATTTTTSTTAPTVTPPAAAPAPTAASVEQLTLSTVELQLLSEIDSQQFGFLKLNDDSNVRKRAIITKAIKYLERFIVRSRERQRRAQVTDRLSQDQTVDVRKPDLSRFQTPFKKSPHLSNNRSQKFDRFIQKTKNALVLC